MSHDRHAALADALHRLKTSRFRLTEPRRKLLEAVMRKRASFTTPDLIRDVARAGMDMVTVYRTLELFEELDIIRKCDFSEGAKTFAVTAFLKHEHNHHVVCQKCHRVETLDFCLVEGQEIVLRKMGYTGLKHKLEFTGVCPRCTR